VIVDRSVTFDVLAGSQNVLVVGDRTYGPVQATPQGKVSFPLQVDPRQLTAKLQTVRGTERTEKMVDVPIADYPRVLVLPMAPRVPGSSDVTHDVWAVAIQKTRRAPRRRFRRGDDRVDRHPHARDRGRRPEGGVVGEMDRPGGGHGHRDDHGAVDARRARRRSSSCRRSPRSS
jgi:hypothetical protein